jgi:hypothetical protein
VFLELTVLIMSVLVRRQLPSARSRGIADHVAGLRASRQGTRYATSCLASVPEKSCSVQALNLHLNLRLAIKPNLRNKHIV